MRGQRRSDSKLLKLNPTTGAQASSGRLDSFQEPWVILQAIIKPVIF